MNRLQALLASYDTAIWVRVIGTMLTTVTTFMLRPFLVLYLYDKLGGAIVLPMVIVGLQPLAGFIVSIWGGGLADRYGRKPLMLYSLVIQAASMVGFAFAENVWAFACLTTLSGIAMSLFMPAANAQISDVVPEEKRAEVFALLHTAFNVGAAMGPAIGLVLFKQNPAIVFSIAAMATLLYFLIVLWKVPETLPPEARLKVEQKQSTPFHLREHMNLVWLTLLGVPVGLLYAQVESTFPLHLKEHFTNFENIFVTLMTLNGIFVILMQIWIAKKTESIAPQRVLFVAYILLGFVSLGYGYSRLLALLILVELIFTIGEMLNGPHIQKVVSKMAPVELRGRYFSIFSFSWQGSKAFGPALGGLLFTNFGGEALFTILAVIIFLSAFAQARLVSRVEREREAEVPLATH